MSVFVRPLYWQTDLGLFEGAGISGNKGGDGLPYRLVLVRWQRGGRWGEFEQIRLNPAGNPDVEFDQWRYRVTGYVIVPGDLTLSTAVQSLPVTGCGHGYFPSPGGVGEVQLIDGRRVCAPCSDVRERTAMRNPGPRATGFEFVLGEASPSGQMRVTTPLGGLVGTAKVVDTQARTNPGGAAWTRRRYAMRDVFGHAWEGSGSASTTLVKFKRVRGDS